MDGSLRLALSVPFGGARVPSSDGSSPNKHLGRHVTERCFVALRSALTPILSAAMQEGGSSIATPFTRDVQAALFLLHTLCMARLWEQLQPFLHKLNMVACWEEYRLTKKAVLEDTKSTYCKSPAALDILSLPYSFLGRSTEDKNAQGPPPTTGLLTTPEWEIIDQISFALRCSLVKLPMTKKVSTMQQVKESVIAGVLFSVSCDQLLVLAAEECIIQDTIVFGQGQGDPSPSSASGASCGERQPAEAASLKKVQRQIAASREVVLATIHTCFNQDWGTLAHGPHLLAHCFSLLEQLLQTCPSTSSESVGSFSEKSGALQGGTDAGVGDSEEEGRQRKQEEVDWYGLRYQLSRILPRLPCRQASGGIFNNLSRAQRLLQLLNSASYILRRLHTNDGQVLSKPAPHLIIAPAKPRTLTPAVYLPGTVWTPDTFSLGPAPIAACAAAAAQKACSGLDYVRVPASNLAMAQQAALALVRACGAMSDVLGSFLANDSLADYLDGQGFKNANLSMVKAFISTCTSALELGCSTLNCACSRKMEPEGDDWCDLHEPGLFHIGATELLPLCAASAVQLLQLALHCLLRMPHATWPDLTTGKRFRPLAPQLALLYKSATESRRLLLNCATTSLLQKHGGGSCLGGCAAESGASTPNAFHPEDAQEIASAPCLLNTLPEFAQASLSIVLQPGMTTLMFRLYEVVSFFFNDMKVCGNAYSFGSGIPDAQNQLDVLMINESSFQTDICNLLSLASDGHLSQETVSLLLGMPTWLGYFNSNELWNLEENGFYQRIIQLFPDGPEDDPDCAILENDHRTVSVLATHVIPLHLKAVRVLQQLREQGGQAATKQQPGTMVKKRGDSSGAGLLQGGTQSTADSQQFVEALIRNRALLRMLLQDLGGGILTGTL